MSQAVMHKDAEIIEKNEFYYHVIEGLQKEQKKLHPKYFYDKAGSEYFDEICKLEEYYPYKTELKLLPAVAKILPDILQDDYSLIEFGAGSLSKVKPLLECMDGIKQFIPIDISGEHLRHSCKQLNTMFPGLDVCPVEGDFTQEVQVKNTLGLKRLGFFPGSTIGNLTPVEARKFLQNAGVTLGDNSYLLIGVDTKKSPNQLHRAYNDKRGITARFNENILHRINQHFDGAVNVENFEHYAFYNTIKGCIEMHLVCIEAHNVELDGVEIGFSKGESIHTESSYKYAPEEFQVLACSAGWGVEQIWLDNDELFSVFLLKNERD
ncbi:MAG: L-histidine N(alpha)-methyltransferase [Agarilytica sp.]